MEKGTDARQAGQPNGVLYEQAAGYARKMARVFPDIDRRDVEQEAVAACLAARARGGIDETRGGAIYYVIARRAVGEAVAKWRSPVTVSNGVAERGEAPRSALDDDICGRETPESLLAAAQLGARVETLRAAIARVEDHAARRLPGFIREMGAVARFDRYPGMHAAMAAKYGITVGEVIRGLGRYTHTVRQHPSVKRLRAELADVIAEIGT
jgi:hypothetical protein